MEIYMKVDPSKRLPEKADNQIYSDVVFVIDTSGDELGYAFYRYDIERWNQWDSFIAYWLESIEIEEEEIMKKIDFEVHRHEGGIREMMDNGEGWDSTTAKQYHNFMVGSIWGIIAKLMKG